MTSTDPNKVLEDIRRLTDKFDRRGLTALESGELATLIIELDDWLKVGGLLPIDWGKAQIIPGNYRV